MMEPIVRALIWATFDGITSQHYGIGVQAHSFITHASKRGDGLGSMDSIYMAYPMSDRSAATAEIDDDVYTASLMRMQEARVHPMPLPFSAEMLWTPEAWDELCGDLSIKLERLSQDFDEIVVIAIDAVYTGLWDALVERVNSREVLQRIRVVHCLYSSALLKGTQPLEFRLAREKRCVELANQGTVDIAYVGDYFNSHLEMQFGLSSRQPRFVQSLVLDDPDLAPVEADWAADVLQAHGIPMDRTIIAFGGRSDPIKGLDLLIEALGALHEDFLFVCLAIPYFEGDPNLDVIRHQLGEARFDYLLFSEFSRALFRALAGHAGTVAVVVPSRDEPVGLIPQEVGLWAEHQGAICVASDAGGLAEQIENGRTGLLFGTEQTAQLTHELARALRMSTEDLSAMRRAAAEKVRTERDYSTNFGALMCDFTSLVSSQKRIRSSDVVDLRPEPDRGSFGEDRWKEIVK